MGKRNIRHGVIKVNTYARSLQNNKYRQRVVPSKKKYKRNRREDHE